MKEIMEIWRKKIVLEKLRLDESWDFSGEEEWQMADDSDFGVAGKWDDRKFGDFVLILLNDEYVNIKYPDNNGKNHGLVSHAIKHSIEVGVDLSVPFNKFKQEIKNKLSNGESIYVRIPGIELNVDSNMINALKSTIGVSKKEKISALRTIGPLFGIDVPENYHEITRIKYSDRTEEQKYQLSQVSNLSRIRTKFNSKILPVLENPKEVHMLTNFDFHYDIGELHKLNYFDPNFIVEYRDMANEIVSKYKDKFKLEDRGASITLEDGLFVALNDSGKIKTFLRART